MMKMNRFFAIIGVIILFLLAFVLGYVTVQAEDADARISDVAYQACIDYGEEYNISPEFLMAIIEAESGGKRTAKNGNCLGLMQVSKKWNANRMKKLGVTDLYDERQNIHVGADILAELFQEYQDPSLVLDKYNGNSKAMYNAENGIISKYADKVLTRSAELERIHGK